MRRATSWSPTTKPWCRRLGRSTWVPALDRTALFGQWAARIWITPTCKCSTSVSCGDLVHSSFSLLGRSAMITGANTGLGQAIAIALAEAGADIVTVGRTDPVETKAAVLAEGRRFFAVHADLGSTQAVSTVVGAALAE